MRERIKIKWWPCKNTGNHSKKIRVSIPKKLILDNHNLSVDTNADRCTTPIWCSRTDQRRRRRCLAPKLSSCTCHGTGCCFKPLPSELCCVWPLKLLLSCYWAFSGFVAVIFPLGWGSPVDDYWFQKHQLSGSTTVMKRGRDVIRNPDVLLQIDKGEAHPKTHVCFDKRKKYLGIFFYTSTSRIFCCRPLHRTSAVAAQSHRWHSFARRW